MWLRWSCWPRSAWSSSSSPSAWSSRSPSSTRRGFCGGGGFRVGGTILLISAGAWVLGLPGKQAVFFGFLLALSSTAIVLKILMDRGEIDSPQGRFTVGILLFQGLCVVPLMLLTPLLSGKEASSLAAILWVLSKVVFTVTLIFVLSRFLVPG